MRNKIDLVIQFFYNIFMLIALISYVGFGMHFITEINRRYGKTPKIPEKVL